jgi:tetratricopeptide (TPR) repeat protein
MKVRRFGLVSIIVAFACVSTVVLAQQSDTYAEEYDFYMKVQQEQDPAKQQAMCLEFVRKYKKSQLDPNVSYLYAQQYQAYRDRGQWQQLANVASKFLQYRPSDQSAAAAATEAYQKLGQPEKLVQFGTRIYQQAPSAETAYLVAKAYKTLNDTANFQKWAERTLRHAPNNAEMLVELVSTSWTGGELAKAAGYAERALKSMASAGPDANQAKAFCYRAIGEQAYVNADARAAQAAFEKAVELDPKNDFGQLRLGYCYWRANRVDQAIQSFARSVALGGSSAREARQQLYDLLRRRYGNTSNAVKMIDAAKKELGVS